LSLSPFTVRNYTKKTKYEALENNSVSERKYCKSAVSSIAATLEKPRFVGRFSAFIGREIQRASVIGGGRGTGFEPSPRGHVVKNTPEYRP
jgi:hypothetical protein